MIGLLDHFLLFYLSLAFDNTMHAELDYRQPNQQLHNTL